jgi:type I restriction enzyme M protein
VVCNRNKPAARKHKVLFIDALNEVTRERAQSFLKPEHQQRILQAFQKFAAMDGFSATATQDQIMANGANLSIPLYVKRLTSTPRGSIDQPVNLKTAWLNWQNDGHAFWQQMDNLIETLNQLTPENNPDA